MMGCFGCPWPPPPPGVLVPRIEDYDFARMGEVVTCFVRHITGEIIPADAPLARWLAYVAEVEIPADVDIPGGAGETLESDVAHPDSPVDNDSLFLRVVDLLWVGRLDFSIRVLCNHPEAVHVERAFVTDELLRSDYNEPLYRGSTPTRMPAGVETLYLAARLFQADGGTIRVCSRETEGHDIEWAPRSANGSAVWFERKQRAFTPGLHDDRVRFRRWFEDEVTRAAARLPGADDTARIVVAGAVLPSRTAQSLHDDDLKGIVKSFWDREPGSASAAAHDPGIPDGVCQYLIGIEIDGTTIRRHELPSFIEIVTTPPRPVLDAVRPALRRAFAGGRANE